MKRSVTGRAAAFDAYWMVDWSGSNTPKLGADSIWSALLRRGDDGTEQVETVNWPTRAALVAGVDRALRTELRHARVLLGFDFPLGYPAGTARSLGHRGPVREAWRWTWRRLVKEIADSDRNVNNRFLVAARLNAEITGSFGPFYGRPPTSDPLVTRHLSSKRIGFFDFPLPTLRGAHLARVREADRSAGAASSPWFLYGGGNSVGGQALVGIPRVAQLRALHDDARVWPFETGARLPGSAEARVVMAEIYPSMFHVREKVATDVHDRLQVMATVRALARLDGGGDDGNGDDTLARLFAAVPAEDAIVHEEGWVLGGR